MLFNTSSATCKLSKRGVNGLQEISPTAECSISVGIVDDHPVIREGLSSCLSSQKDICVVGSAANAVTALELIRIRRIDVLLLDVDLPGRTGLDLLPLLHRISPTTAILVFTSYPVENYALKMLSLGAMGFLSKNCELDELLRAIRSLSCGSRHLTAEISELLATSLAARAEPPHKLLTSRELQVFLKLARGFRTGTIAEYLSLSEKTVAVYRSRIKRKLELKSASDFTYYALKHQLIS
ncbi:MAG: two component transcriptional regulator, LuxR family [Variovorax sp.]|nr:two component transcriptional regulator, LuxR family [Variovorax sp.]